MIEGFKRLLGIDQVAMRLDGETLVLFVHGLAGCAMGTWRSMLKVLSADKTLIHVAFDCYTFPTSLIRIPFFSRRPGVRELASGLRTYLKVHHADKKNVILVGHSLGGLVIRQYILDVLETDEGARLSGTLLYAVPNSGSAWAHVNSALSWRHLQANQLKPSSDMLDSINREWTRRSIEGQLVVEFVIGGLDAVVAKESGAWSQGGNHQTIIGHGHRTIVKPKGADDTSFKLLQSFVHKISAPQEVVLPLSLVPPINEASINVDPLFDIYTPGVEPYYEVRDTDLALASATSGAHVWVSGLSGVGKTAALKRLADLSNWRLEHVILSSYQNRSANALIAAICNQLYERFGFPDIVVPSNTDTTTILNHLEQIYVAVPQNTVLAIFVEEIPISPGPEYAEFLEMVYHIILACKDLRGQRKVVWMFSSINDPNDHINSQLRHFRERMQFIKIERWSDQEIRRLIAKIKRSRSIKISTDNVRKLVGQAEGIPRFVKMVLRRSRNEVGRRSTFEELLQSVKKDLGV